VLCVLSRVLSPDGLFVVRHCRRAAQLIRFTLSTVVRATSWRGAWMPRLRALCGSNQIMQRSRRRCESSPAVDLPQADATYNMQPPVGACNMQHATYRMQRATAPAGVINGRSPPDFGIRFPRVFKDLPKPKSAHRVNPSNCRRCTALVRAALKRGCAMRDHRCSAPAWQWCSRVRACVCACVRERVSDA
jgi:hypothetical protein